MGKSKRSTEKKWFLRSFSLKSSTDLFKQDVPFKLLTGQWKLPREYLKQYFYLFLEQAWFEAEESSTRVDDTAKLEFLNILVPWLLDVLREIR